MPEIPIAEVPKEWLLQAAIEAHNDGRESLEDFDGDHLEFLADGIAAVIPLIREYERHRIAEEIRALADPKHDGYTPERFDSFLKRGRITYHSQLRRTLRAAADEINSQTPGDGHA